MRSKLYLSGGVLSAAMAAGLTFAYVSQPNDPFALCRDENMIDFTEIGAQGFDLSDENGRLVRDVDVLSRPTLMYMGYTFCPDVCPLDNMRNAQAIEILEEQNIDFQAVFVSIDPERDTPEILASFTDNFHPEMIGLTGTSETVSSFAEAYHMFFEFQETDTEYYLIDHSTWTYVVLPDHGVVDLVSRAEDAFSVADRASCLAAQVT